MPLAVREFFNNERQLHLQFVAGDGGLSRPIRTSEIVRPAVAFAAGLWALGKKGGESPRLRRSDANAIERRISRALKTTAHIRGAVWVIGSLELAALLAAPPAMRAKFLEMFSRLQPAAAVFTDGLSPAKLDPALVRQTAIPVFTTRLSYTRFLAAFHTFLANRLAPRTDAHGTFVTLFGLGVLLQGPSGIGKSEIALSLIERGHPLVADDTVQIRVEEDRELVGSAPELGRHHMEIRGLGILNVRQLFGAVAVVDEHPIHLVVDLLPMAASRREERLGGFRVKTILGVQVPRVTVQVRTGRNMAVIVEAAARNQKLRSIGYDTAGTFRRQLAKHLLARS